MMGIGGKMIGELLSLVEQKDQVLHLQGRWEEWRRKEEEERL